MELIMEVKVILGEHYAVSGKKETINMISFTGTASGKYFNGKVIGTGVDTQRINNNHNGTLSARYMLEGTDYKNNKCRVFIENNGQSMDNCIPYLVTDSEALSYLQEAKLHSKVVPIENGVLVSIYTE